MSFIPNILTLANLMCGMLGIFSLIDDSFSSFFIGTLPLEIGTYFVFGGAFFDLLDGFSARILKVESKLGAHLDSLADLVTFGVLPALILSRISYIGLVKYYPQSYCNSTFIHIMPLFLPLCTAYRLARFNTKKINTEYFEGLSSTATGIFVGLLTLTARSTTSNITKGLILDPYVISSLSMFLSFLMISDVHFTSFKFKNFRIKDNLTRYVLFLNFISLSSILHISGALIGMFIYILWGIFGRVWAVIKSFFSDF